MSTASPSVDERLMAQNVVKRRRSARLAAQADDASSPADESARRRCCTCWDLPVQTPEMLRSPGPTQKVDEAGLVEDGIPLQALKEPRAEPELPSPGLSPRDQRAMALLVVLCALRYDGDRR